MAQKKRFTRKPRLLILPLVKKKKKKKAIKSGSCAKHLGTALARVCGNLKELIFKCLGGCQGGGGGGKGGNVEAMN